MVAADVNITDPLPHIAAQLPTRSPAAHAKLRAASKGTHRFCLLGPIHTTRHVSVPSSFPLRSVRLICVHTVCRVQSLSGIARDRRPALISISYAASFVF